VCEYNKARGYTIRYLAHDDTIAAKVNVTLKNLSQQKQI
jgi:hypothetical protein